MTEKPETKLPFTESDLISYLEAAGLAFVSMERKLKDSMDISDAEFIRLRKPLEDFLDTEEKNTKNVDEITNALRDSLSEILEEPGLMIPEELRKAGIEACKAHERTLARREHA